MAGEWIHIKNRENDYVYFWYEDDAKSFVEEYPRVYEIVERPPIEWLKKAIKNSTELIEKEQRHLERLVKTLGEEHSTENLLYIYNHFESVRSRLSRRQGLPTET